MIRRGLSAAVMGLAGLAACGPVPVEQAERACMDSARLAERPRGNVELGVGVGNGGPRTMGRVEIDVSSDYIMGRDPSQVYQSCVLRRSGQLPTRPYHDAPGGIG